MVSDHVARVGDDFKLTKLLGPRQVGNLLIFAVAIRCLDSHGLLEADRDDVALVGQACDYGIFLVKSLPCCFHLARFSFQRLVMSLQFQASAMRSQGEPDRPP